MIYSATIKTEANTAKVDTVNTVIRITKGLVWLVEVEFPAGCSGLAHIQIFDGKYQLFPASPGDSLHSDGAVLSFDDLYLKQAAPFQFVIKTWNLDETHPHTLQVRIGFASSEVFMSRYMPSVTWDKFNESLKLAAQEQERLRQEQIVFIANQVGM